MEFAVEFAAGVLTGLTHHDQEKSSVTIVTNLMPMLVMPMLVKGTPSEIASAHRIHGKKASQRQAYLFGAWPHLFSVILSGLSLIRIDDGPNETSAWQQRPIIGD